MAKKFITTGKSLKKRLVEAVMKDQVSYLAWDEVKNIKKHLEDKLKEYFSFDINVNILKHEEGADEGNLTFNDDNETVTLRFVLIHTGTNFG